MRTRAGIEYRSPRHFHTQRFAAGLRACEIWRAAFPGATQWHRDAPTLAYRCGGSTGIDLFPDSPVPMTLATGTSNRVAAVHNYARRRGHSTPERNARGMLRGNIGGRLNKISAMAAGAPKF